MPKRTHDGIKKRCDCARRQWSKCAHPWHFSFHHRGVEHRYSLDTLARARHVPTPTSKSEAVAWRDRLRNEIRAGTFVDPGAPTPAPDARLTFGDICDEYEKAHVNAPTRRDGARQAMTWNLSLIRRTELPAAHGATIRFEQKPVDAITRADVEAFRLARRALLAAATTTLERVAGLEREANATADRKVARALRSDACALRRTAKARPGVKGGEVGINRLLARLRHVFSWAIKAGHTDQTPFKRAGEVVVELATRAETARTRRLDQGEEERLLLHAGPHLRALIVAALSTGCRLGELLSLQWNRIRLDDEGEARWMLLTAERTKTNEARTIPIGPRLRAELSMRRHGANGEAHAGDRYVFGNDEGKHVASIKTAWRATCRRAGIVGLHFHDLRREFGSRLLESGAAQHDVRDFLGHANITTTSRYLRSTPLRLERALAMMDAGFAQDSHNAGGSVSVGAMKQPAPLADNAVIQ